MFNAAAAPADCACPHTHGLRIPHSHTLVLDKCYKNRYAARSLSDTMPSTRLDSGSTMTSRRTPAAACPWRSATKPDDRDTKSTQMQRSDSGQTMRL